MTRRSRAEPSSLAAFTLVELLVASTIGLMLAGLATSMLWQVNRTSTRSQTRVALHDTAAVIFRRLNTTLGPLHPGTQIRCDVDPGPDGILGTNDEIITLTWMAPLVELHQETYGTGRDHRHDLVWHRLRWIGHPLPEHSELQVATSTGYRVVKTTAPDPIDGQNRNVTIKIDPQPRRDRRRDLDDNDLRFVPGATATTVAHYDVDGDAEDLERRLGSLTGPGMAVDRFRLSWQDRQGWTTSVGVNGIVVTDTNGVVVSPTAAAMAGGWWTQRRLILDGTFLDGRGYSLPGDLRPVNLTRPVLMRISFSLRDISREGGNYQAHLDESFDFSICTQPSLSTP